LDEFDGDLLFTFVGGCTDVVTGSWVDLSSLVLVTKEICLSLDMVREVVCLLSGDALGEVCNSSWYFYACQDVNVGACLSSAEDQW